MAIAVRAPRTVDDAATTELCPLENHFQVISDGDAETCYYDEGDNVVKEAAEEGKVILQSFSNLLSVLAQFMTLMMFHSSWIC